MLGGKMTRSRQIGRWLLAVPITVASFVGGFYAGIWISGIGDDADGAALVARGVVFIGPMLVIALLVNWRWLAALLLYVLGFFQGYTLFDGIAESIGSTIHGVFAVFALPGALLSGSDLPTYQRETTSWFQNHPELVWYLDLALLFVSVVAILRHQRHAAKNAQQGVSPQPAARSESDFAGSPPPST
jgi:hypothetical protein